MATRRKFSRGNGGKEIARSIPAPSVAKPKTAGKEKKGNTVPRFKEPIRSGKSVKE
jgi:hypothetical protein